LCSGCCDRILVTTGLGLLSTVRNARNTTGNLYPQRV
jgi:hypothetical protein